MFASESTPRMKFTSRQGGSATIRGLCVLGLALWLAGCGTSSLTGGSAAEATQTAHSAPLPTADETSTAQATQSPASGGSATSCSPGGQQTANVGNPTYVLTAATSGRTVTAHVGDTIQVRLPSSSRWSLQAAPSSAVLAAVAPSAMYVPSLNACVWTFQAKASGSATLNYGGAPICKPGQACAAYRIAMDFSVKVA